MKMKTILMDLVFIIAVTAVLIILSETDHMDYVTKWPFITVLVAYTIGRFAGYLSHKNNASK